MSGTNHKASRGRRSRKRGTASTVRSILRQERHLFESGQRFNPSIHPPDFMAIPWFNLTVRLENFTSIAHSIEASGVVSLPAQLKSQLNLPVATVIEFRVQSVRIWGAILPMNSGSALSNLRAQLWSVVPMIPQSTGATFVILEDISAYPDQVSRASLGFTWPKSQQAIPLQEGTSGTLVTLSSGGGAGVVAYFKVVWRPRPSFGAVEPANKGGSQSSDDDIGGFVTSVE